MYAFEANEEGMGFNCYSELGLQCTEGLKMGRAADADIPSIVNPAADRRTDKL